MKKQHELTLRMSVTQIAREAIELFLQYRDGYGKTEDESLEASVQEFAESEEFIEVIQRAKPKARRVKR